MKKSLFSVMILATMLGGCGYVDRQIASVTGDATKTCVDGVTYLQFTSGATVQFDTQGHVVPCNK